MPYVQDITAESAIKDCPTISLDLISPRPQHGLLDAARMLYELNHFREASNILKDICKNYPENRSAKHELTRTISRLLEQQRGFYNFRMLYSEAASLRPPCLDHATYVGAVEVREAKGMGRGMFTTKAVKAGDFLVCEKAFGYSYADVVEEESSGTSASLILNIVQKLTENTHLISSFNEIYHGEHVAAVGADGVLIVDRVLIERVVALNSFGGSLSTRATHLADAGTVSGHSSGVWALAARLNHSCFSNCRRSFIGDMQIIRAAQDIAAGTQLSSAYRIPAAKAHDYQNTQAELKGYGFTCACPLCVDALNTSDELLATRAELRDQLTMAFATGSFRGSFDCTRVDTAQIERVLLTLEATYTAPASLVPRTGLWDPYLALTRMHIVLNQPEKVIWGALKTMEMLGFVITGGNLYLKENEARVIVVEKWGLVVDYLVEFWLIIWTAYAKLGDKGRADMARSFATVSYRIVVGEDETFEESYGGKARKLIGEKKLWRSF